MRRPRLRLLAWLCVATALSGAAWARTSKLKAVPPSPADYPRIVADLASRLAGTTVRAFDGTDVPVVAGPARAAGSPEPLLDAERLTACLATIAEAGAWPSAWLVVQDASRPYDLILHLVLDASGVRVEGVPFTARRRDWDADAVDAAVLAVTGARPPKERARNVVIQTFRKRVVTTYVYEPSKPRAETGGLIDLLPKGSVIRETRGVETGNRYHTLAVVLREARFLPSNCSSCAEKLFGHTDSGRVSVVLAADGKIESVLDLEALLHGLSGRAEIPRFPCTPADEDPAEREKPYERRFAAREAVRILDLTDWNGDGLALEFALPAEFLDCGRHTRVVIGVDPREPRIRNYGERMERSATSGAAGGSP